MKASSTEYGDLSGTQWKSSISYNSMNLTSLEGVPETVGKSFVCIDNELTTLEYGPKKVGKNYSIGNNLLTNLIGAPEFVGGDFSCVKNKLTSLEGLPKHIGGKFFCSGNKLSKQLKEEYKIRMENPDLSEGEIKLKMYELTKDERYLPTDAKDIFLF